jgi:hypothetical protein
MAQHMFIAAFDELEPAEGIARKLREVEIHAEVRDESGEQKWKLFNMHPRAHIRVMVPEEESDAAAVHLREWSSVEGAMKQAICCPECGSFRVEYPQFSRRTIVGALPAALAAAGVIERDFYCEACHFTWLAEAAKPEPELDSLGWPKKDAVA